MKPKEIEKVDETVVKDVENEAGEPVRTYPRVDKQHAAYKILVDSGIDKKEAALILGYRPKSAYEIEKRLEKKGKRIEVATQKMVRKSVRNLEKLIDAQPFGTLERVKDSTVLSAIEVVLDRSHPKIQAAPPAPRLSFVEINVDIARADLHLGPGTTPTGGITVDGKTINGEPASTPTGTWVRRGWRNLF